MALNLILNSKNRIVSQFVTSPSANERLLVVEFCVNIHCKERIFSCKKKGDTCFSESNKSFYDTNCCRKEPPSSCAFKWQSLLELI